MIEEEMCQLCFKKQKYLVHEAEEDEDSMFGGSYTYLPKPWCHDYNSDGGTIYFCTREHLSIWQRAVYLSWQAVSLLREFARTMQPKDPQGQPEQKAP